MAVDRICCCSSKTQCHMISLSITWSCLVIVLFNPETSIPIQRHHPYTGNQNSKTAFLHCFSSHLSWQGLLPAGACPSRHCHRWPVTHGKGDLLWLDGDCLHKNNLGLARLAIHFEYCSISVEKWLTLHALNACWASLCLPYDYHWEVFLHKQQNVPMMLAW